MNIRKLVKSGLASYVVALPKEWIDKNKLKKGDLLYIDEKNSEELIVSTKLKESPREKTEIVINIDGKPNHLIFREISSAYIHNFFRIIIKGKELVKKVEYIKKILQGMAAVEVIDESSERVIVRDFLDIKDVSINDLIRRMDNITRSMIIDARQCLVDHELCDVVYLRDTDVNRLNFLIKKIIREYYKDHGKLKTGELDNLKALEMWGVNMHIEKIADETKAICILFKELSKENKKFDKVALEKILLAIEDHYKTTMKAFYNVDTKLADMESGKKKELVKILDEFSVSHKSITASEISGKFKSMVSHINDISRLISTLG